MVSGYLQSKIHKGNPKLANLIRYQWDYYMNKKKHKAASKWGNINNIMSKIAWGNHRIFIRNPGAEGSPHADKAKMYGRGGFFIHGGSIQGSSGCLDLGDEMDDFAKFWAANTAATRRGIRLYVNYDSDIVGDLLKKNPSLAKQKWFKMIFNKKTQQIYDHFNYRLS